MPVAEQEVPEQEDVIVESTKWKRDYVVNVDVGSDVEGPDDDQTRELVSIREEVMKNLHDNSSDDSDIMELPIVEDSSEDDE